MRSSVTVNGVTLTREQVEGAVIELNKPGPPTIFYFDSESSTQCITDLKTQKTIFRRTGGEWAGKGLYLPDGFEWRIYVDAAGKRVLVGTRMAP